MCGMIFTRGMFFPFAGGAGSRIAKGAGSPIAKGTMIETVSAMLEPVSCHIRLIKREARKSPAETSRRNRATKSESQSLLHAIRQISVLTTGKPGLIMKRQ